MRDWEWEIPGHWVRKTLGDIATWGSGGTPKATEARYYGGGIPWLVIGDLNDGVVTASAKTITETGLANSSAKYVEPGSIMVAMYGSIGKLGIAGTRCTTNQAIAFTKAISKEIEPQYLFHYLASVRDLLLAEGKGGAQANISQTVLKQIPFCYPPRSEQQRISKKLDHIAAHLDDTRARLETIPTILKRFRMSVLAAACSGKLTDAWRERPDYSELEGICAVPSTWAKTSLGNLLEPDRGICYGVIKLGAECGDGIPCLRTSDVKPLAIDLSGVKKISREIADQYKRTYLKGGEVLVNVRGTLGGVAVVPGTLAGWNVSREVAVVPVDRQRISPEFASYWVASPYAQAWLTDVAKGAAYTGINLSDLRLLPIAVPELDEQAEIVRRVRALLAQADDIEERYQKAKTFMERLMPSVLAKAFNGELCS